MITDELVQRAKDGDTDSRNDLFVYSLYYVWQYARKFARETRIDVEDLRQSAFEVFDNWLDKYDANKSKWQTYFHRRFKWYCRDFARRRENHPVCQYTTRSGFTSVSRVSLSSKVDNNRAGQQYRFDCEPATEHVFEDEGFFALLRGMSKAERILFILYYHEQLTMKEIGAELNLHHSRVSQMHKAVIERLRRTVQVEA